MATQNIQVRINLRANSNRKSDYYGHLYPYLDRMGTLDTRGFCKHMSDHGTMFDRATIEGVMTTMQGCLVELLSQGVAVKLTGIGTFYPSVESVKGGAQTLEEAESMGADNLVNGHLEDHEGEVLADAAPAAAGGRYLHHSEGRDQEALQVRSHRPARGRRAGAGTLSEAPSGAFVYGKSYKIS